MPTLRQLLTADRYYDLVTYRAVVDHPGLLCTILPSGQ